MGSIKGRMVALLALGAVGMVAGCAAGQGGAVPTTEDDGVDLMQVITSVNADGTWTEDALTPNTTSSGYASAAATFTGPAGKKRGMGVCLVSLTRTACNTESDCLSYYGTTNPTPNGGWYYCAAEDGLGQKHCALRNGKQAAWCAGTPALPWTNPTTGATCTPSGPPSATCAPTKVSPGTYTTPSVFVGKLANVLSYACFENCTNSTSDSTSPSAPANGDCAWQNGVYICW